MKYSEKKKLKALALIDKGATCGEAAKRCKVSAGTIYNWQKARDKKTVEVGLMSDDNNTPSTLTYKFEGPLNWQQAPTTPTINTKDLEDSNGRLVTIKNKLEMENTKLRTLIIDMLIKEHGNANR